MTGGTRKKAKGSSSDHASASQQLEKRRCTERSKHFWYCLCETYTSRYSHMSLTSFLHSEASDPDIDGRNSSVNSFANYVKEFNKRALQPRSAKRQKV
jgi:hypothetical protein